MSVFQKINVLDKGYVELLDMMPHPSLGIGADLAVVNAARVSFLGESKGEEADRKLLRYMMRNGHTSPFEQVAFKFRVKAPLVVWWQWMRHRTWSFNSQSGRYTEFEHDDFYIPDAWRAQSTSNKQASDGAVSPEADEELNHLFNLAVIEGHDAYEYALKLGAAREMARMFLPAFAVYYTVVASVDAHNLMHFLRLRDHDHAQHEIREYARALKRIMREAMPWTMEEFEAQKNPGG